MELFSLDSLMLRVGCDWLQVQVTLHLTVSQSVTASTSLWDTWHFLNAWSLTITRCLWSWDFLSDERTGLPEISSSMIAIVLYCIVLITLQTSDCLELEFFSLLPP